MKTLNQQKDEKYSGTELKYSELLEINGGSEEDIAYLVGYTYVFTMAHFLTLGFSTYAYLYKKLTS